MFDNPKKNLESLDAQLRSLEPEEAFPEQEEEWEEEDLSPGQNPAVDFARMAYADESLAEEDVLLKQKRTRRAKVSRNSGSGKDRKKQKSKKKKRPLGLQYLVAIGEIILIIVIVRWWLQWIK